MISAVSRYRWAILCATLLSFGPLDSPAQAWWYSSYGYGSYYAPVSYTAGYRYTAGYGYGGGCGSGGCCLTSLFHGCGLFGCYRPTYSSCYAPSYCNSGCGSCGTSSCGYGSCGYGSCGYGCSTCGSSCSGSCGSSCWGACATGNCAGGDCGISTPAYSADPASSGAAGPPNPGTYAPKSTPESNMADPGGGFVLPADTDDGAQSNPGDSEIERSFDFNSNKIPANAEPGSFEELKVEDDTAQPLKLDMQLVYRVQPERTRAHYRAVFRTPQVARADVPARSEWTPIEVEAQLASSN